MKLKYIFPLLMLGSLNLTYASSDYVETLKRIVASNPQLKAQTARLKAEKAENLTGLNLPNPEVEFAYQFGNAAAEYDKQILDVTQEFDFATLSGAKHKMADAMNSEAETALYLVMNNLTSEVDMLMTQKVYLLRLDGFYRQRVKDTEDLYNIANQRFEQGAISIVEFNQAKMELLLARNELTLNEIETATVSDRIKTLSGGSLEWNGTNYMDYILPIDYENWAKSQTAQDPLTLMAMAQAKRAESEVRLRKKEQLPGFSLGYSSEMTKAESFYGFKVGLELPFWSNKGKVKAAKQAKEAADIETEVAIEDFMLTERAAYNRATQLARSLGEVKKITKESDFSNDLKTLLDEGQISINDYLLQLKPIRDMQHTLIESEFAYQQALVDFRNLR